MEAVRSIQKVENGEINLQLPEQFWGQEVEIIVIIAPNQAIIRKKSLRGCLKQYANPDLISQESEIWPEHIGEKYEHS